MLSSPAIILGSPATRNERRAGRAITTVRELTNGAPCLGVALGLACLVWVGIGSAVAPALH
jgi:anthranilate/para-aminobenzoate synthase component II